MPDSKNTINVGQVLDTINSTIDGDNTTIMRVTRGDNEGVYEIKIPIVELMKAAGQSNSQLNTRHASLSFVKHEAALALAGNRQQGRG